MLFSPCRDRPHRSVLRLPVRRLRAHHRPSPAPSEHRHHAAHREDDRGGEAAGRCLGLSAGWAPGQGRPWRGSGGAWACGPGRGAGAASSPRELAVQFWRQESSLCVGPGAGVSSATVRGSKQLPAGHSPADPGSVPARSRSQPNQVGSHSLKVPSSIFRGVLFLLKG